MLHIIITALLSASALMAGLKDDLSRAQRFERTGDFESALIVYRNLYVDHSTEQAVVEGLKRNYRRLEKFDELVLLLQHMRDRNPQDLGAALDLAEMLYLTRQAGRADTLLAQLANETGTEPERYHRIAAVYAKFGKWTRARELYGRARRVTGDDRLFIDETALTWLKQQDYRRAGTEYLRHFSAYNEREYEHILEKLDLFPAEPAVFDQLAGIIGTAAEKAPDKKRLYFYKLKSELYLMFGRYDDAFGEQQRMDRLTGREGKVLLDFLGFCLQEQRWHLAVRVGAALEKRYPSSRHLPEVYADRARAWTELGKPDRALAVYDSLVSRFPKSPQVPGAWYRMGEIHFRTGDLDRAIDRFNQVLKKKPNSDLLFDAYFRIGDCYVKMGDTGNALKMFDLLAQKTASRQDLKDRSLFKEAETLYLSGNQEKARKLLSAIAVKGSEGLYVNDALELTILLDEKNAAALPGFAAAEFSYRQGKTSQARTAWTRLLQEHPGILTGTVLMRIADTWQAEKNYEEAAAVYVRITNEVQQETEVVTAWVRLGQLYGERLDRPEKAVEVYKKIISSWPRSPHVPAVRRRLRELVKNI